MCQTIIIIPALNPPESVVSYATKAVRQDSVSIKFRKRANRWLRNHYSSRQGRRT